MPAKPTAKPSMLDQAKALKRTANATWEESLTTEQRAEVFAVLRARIAGELNLSLPQLVKLFKDNGLKASIHRVRGAMERLTSTKG